MSIRQNFPTTQPSLVLDFANSKTLDPRITFSRSQTTSNGSTYTGPDGLIKYAGPDEPRFDHRYENGVVKSLGLLIEELRSNLVEYSTISTVAGWSISGSTVTDNATTAPDGTNTAARIQATGNYVADLSISVTAGQTYTFSFWVKSVSGSGTWGINWYEDVTGHNRTTVNVTEEWERVSITFTPTQSQINVYVSDDRDNLATISDAYVWGAQLEQGSFKTSLIPTSGSTATRNPDNVSMTGTNFTDWYNQDEGTVYVSQKLRAVQDDSRNNLVYRISSGGVNENDYFYNTSNGTTNIFVFGDGGTNYSRFQDGTDSTDTKTAWAYDVPGDDFKAYYNGIEATNETNNNTPSATSHTQLELGAAVGAKYCGHISKLTYYPVRLTNSQLQNLTK